MEAIANITETVHHYYIVNESIPIAFLSELKKTSLLCDTVVILT